MESPSRLEWHGDDELVVDGISYGLRAGVAEPFESSADRFCICKASWAIAELEELLAELRPRRIAELGLNKGGSTALISQLTDLERLVGIELDPGPIAGLHEFAEATGVADRLSIHYGTDQADGSALARIAADEFRGEPIDLVIDDASHFLAESRASFDVLFPLLRPGGVYLLEDWSWAHTVVPLWPRREPLTPMVFELVVACGHSPDVIERVDVNRGWAVVRRGPGELPAGDFSLTRLYGERGRALLPPPGAGAESPPEAPGPLRRRFAGLRRRLRG